MKIIDLRKVIFDDVTIYMRGNGEYVDLYTGRMENVPGKLLEEEVRCMGARRDGGGIDIEIRR